MKRGYQMKHEMLLLKPNSEYRVSGRLLTSGSDSFDTQNLRLRTDDAGGIAEFRSSLPAPVYPADWNFISATDIKTGQVIDWRLHDAAMTGNIELAENALAEGVDINSNYIKQRATPLHLASANGHLEVVILLVTNKAQINISDEMGWTPILIAANLNRGDVVAFLYGQGAILTAVINGDEVHLDETGVPDGALLLGAELGDLDAVHRSLDRGADVNCRLQGDGWTSLIMATKKGGEEIVRYLLAKGANPNVSSYAGYTPLMRAAGLGETDLVSILLDANCDISAQDEAGQTAYSIALHEGQLDAAELITRRLG
jgi:ankyrin repeat protein